MQKVQKPDFDEKQWSLITPIIQANIRYLIQLTDQILMQVTRDSKQIQETNEQQIATQKQLTEHQMSSQTTIQQLTSGIQTLQHQIGKIFQVCNAFEDKFSSLKQQLAQQMSETTEKLTNYSKTAMERVQTQLDTKTQQIDDKIKQINLVLKQQRELIEKSAKEQNDKITAFDKILKQKFDQTEKKLTETNKQLEQQDKKFVELNNQLKAEQEKLLQQIQAANGLISSNKDQIQTSVANLQNNFGQFQTQVAHNDEEKQKLMDQFNQTLEQQGAQLTEQCTLTQTIKQELHNIGLRIGATEQKQQEEKQKQQLLQQTKLQSLQDIYIRFDKIVQNNLGQAGSLDTDAIKSQLITLKQDCVTQQLLTKFISIKANELEVNFGQNQMMVLKKLYKLVLKQIDLVREAEKEHITKSELQSAMEDDDFSESSEENMKDQQNQSNKDIGTPKSPGGTKKRVLSSNTSLINNDESVAESVTVDSQAKPLLPRGKSADSKDKSRSASKGSYKQAKQEIQKQNLGMQLTFATNSQENLSENASSQKFDKFDGDRENNIEILENEQRIQELEEEINGLREEMKNMKQNQTEIIKQLFTAFLNEYGLAELIQNKNVDQNEHNEEKQSLDVNRTKRVPLIEGYTDISITKSATIDIASLDQMNISRNSLKDKMKQFEEQKGSQINPQTRSQSQNLISSIRSAQSIPVGQNEAETVKSGSDYKRQRLPQSSPVSKQFEYQQNDQDDVNPENDDLALNYKSAKEANTNDLIHVSEAEDVNDENKSTKQKVSNSKVQQNEQSDAQEDIPTLLQNTPGNIDAEDPHMRLLARSSNINTPLKGVPSSLRPQSVKATGKRVQISVEAKQPQQSSSGDESIRKQDSNVSGNGGSRPGSARIDLQKTQLYTQICEQLTTELCELLDDKLNIVTGGQIELGRELSYLSQHVQQLDDHISASRGPSRPRTVEKSVQSSGTYGRPSGWVTSYVPKGSVQ